MNRDRCLCFQKTGTNIARGIGPKTATRNGIAAAAKAGETKPAGEVLGTAVRQSP